MPNYIFYSWQSDTENRIGRGFIQWALDRAIKALNADADVDPAERDLRADRDTINVSGMPPLADTIFGKIDRAVAFLSDLTHVATRANRQLSPNPNVLLEHGWALKSRGWARMIGVMNTAMGHPDDHPLPFDLTHFKRPILFHCPADASDEDRQAARLGLQKDLESALRLILDDEVLRMAQPPAEPHPHDVELLQRYRAQFPEPLRLFLREHNFGTPYPRRALDPLDEVASTWAGAAFDFEDEALQKAALAVRAANTSLMELVYERVHVMNQNHNMAWVKTDEDVRRGMQPSTLAAVKELNSRSTALIDAVDAFEKVGRSRIRVAAPPPAAPQVDPRWEAAQTTVNELAMDRMRGGLPEIVATPSMTLRIVPLAAMDRPAIDPKLVMTAALRFPPDMQVRVQSDSDERQWWSYGLPLIPTDNNPETRWRTRFVRPGAIEYEATIGTRIDNDPQIVVDGRELETGIVSHLERLVGVLAAVGLTGPGLVSIAFRGVEDVELTRARGGGRGIRKPELFLPELRTDDLSAPMQPQLRDQFNILWQASGWADGSPSFG
ncbi:hypothetical protein [Sphingomonas morindae]|uniref:Uncharacterized protein n=1 Tax=Sphingomonas morindae TaxID=1541170 RepID=A0ABY4XED7_9SPHN|nr:hypothetical protein [Sphingomonas morindae]USI75081.1 hypothetical protein LHA26_19505 [Sphingomonas morindae]